MSEESMDGRGTRKYGSERVKTASPNEHGCVPSESPRVPVVLVTGAAGFIGSHTVDALLAAGCHVVGVDNLRTGKRSNLSTAELSTDFTFYELDVSDAVSFSNLLEAKRPTAIVHLAALVSVQESCRNPELNFRLNLAATHNVAECARRIGIKRMVFASSAAVYGDAIRVPITEDSPLQPISPYGAAKLASENLLLGYGRSFEFTVRCHRYFNVYGTRQDPSSPYSGVVSLFLQRVWEDLPATIFGDGEQTRDFINVADVADANVRAATQEGVISGVANICTGRATSLNCLWTHIRSQANSRREPLYRAARPGDIRDSLGDPTRALIELGFAARIDVRSGIARLVESTSSRAIERDR